MFSLHDTNAIARDAHARIDHLHHVARVESSLSSLHASFRIRIRIANVARRIATWIEPHQATGRVFAVHQPRSD